MSIADLTTFKQFLRELTADLDDPLQMALDSATSECNHFVGLDIEDEFGTGIPADLEMACMTLAQVHADIGDPVTNENRRAAAQRLMLPYRLETGIGAAA